MGHPTAKLFDYVDIKLANHEKLLDSQKKSINYVRKLFQTLGNPMDARQQFVSWFAETEQIVESLCPYSIFLLISGPFNQVLAAKLNQLLQKQFKSLAVKYMIPF